ncbi:hypothetical protein BBJ29_006422 [Phytophthora kernoviae]|uniref:Inositol polyphosphate-related phosphatase domain-containing protein n=1 Tax=Phytophthora kernoviae TaxID=325452 RepID=A0A3F2RJ87_9STRA|nr:hypothetical protein BBJ29_006422 [Phytophthora kernoviae]RLN58273.1 hypothetical protein BBP00_00007089 [Phytophthora kernoviae]
MLSLLGLRWDPKTSRPLRGWANEIPPGYDYDDLDAECEEDALTHNNPGNNQHESEDGDAIAGLKIEDMVENEISRLHAFYSRHVQWAGSDDDVEESASAGSILSACVEAAETEVEDNNVAVDTVVETAEKITVDDVRPESVEGDDVNVHESIEEEEDGEFMFFALTPETCPGPPSPPRPPPQKVQLRIFVGTWNMAAKDPFAHRKRGQYIGDDLAGDALREFLPLGYDIYVIGTQEKVTKHLHSAVLARLKQESPADSATRRQIYRRLALTPKPQWTESCDVENLMSGLSDFGSSWGLPSICNDLVSSLCSPRSAVASTLCDDDPRLGEYAVLEALDENPESPRWNKQREHEDIKGHGDHALLRRKSTGLSVYYASRLHGRVEVVAAGSHKFMGSKGGIGVTLRMLDKLARELPRVLASKKENQAVESSIATCSDHAVWMGDFNYRIKQLDGDDVLRLLSAGRLQELHDHYDSMVDDLKNIPGLQAFREPAKWPTFYPTYKKVPSRSRLPLSGSTTGTGQDTRWAQHVYQTNFREPFYKGGRIRQRVPGWCDRILYCSRSETPWADCLQVEQIKCSDASRGTTSFSPEALRDNYRALNDELRGSDHSPVSCTFLWSVQR